MTNTSDMAKIAKVFSLLGLTRILPVIPYKISKNIQKDVKEHFCQAKMYDAMQKELMAWKKNVEVINSLKAFPQVPLKVVVPDSESNIKEWMSYGVKEELAKRMEALHRELSLEELAYSSKSEFVVVKDSGHGIHLYRPDAIIAEVKNVFGR